MISKSANTCRPIDDVFSELRVNVWDSDVNEKDDFLGRIALPLESVSTVSQCSLTPAQMTEGEGWFTLKRKYMTKAIGVKTVVSP